MSECSCVPPHRAWGQATSKDCLYLSGMLRMKTGMEKTCRPPRCGFPIPSHRTRAFQKFGKLHKEPKETWSTNYFFPPKLWGWHSSGYEQALWKFFPAKVHCSLFFRCLSSSKVVFSLWMWTWGLWPSEFNQTGNVFWAQCEQWEGGWHLIEGASLERCRRDKTRKIVRGGSWWDMMSGFRVSESLRSRQGLVSKVQWLDGFY